MIVKPPVLLLTTDLIVLHCVQLLHLYDSLFVLFKVEELQFTVRFLTCNVSEVFSQA